MPKYKVTATMDVGYSTVVEAKDAEEAYAIAKNTDGCDWVKDWLDGHDWTIEDVYEMEESNA